MAPARSNRSSYWGAAVQVDFAVKLHAPVAVVDLPAVVFATGGTRVCERATVQHPENGAEHELISLPPPFPVALPILTDFVSGRS